MNNKFNQNDKNILSLHNLCKVFKQGLDEITILQDVSVDFFAGKSYLIEGASGSGKSTLLHLLAGLDVPTVGQVCFNEKDINLFDTSERQIYSQKTIGLVFQFPYLIKELSIIENIKLKGLIANESEKQSTDRAHELLHLVGLFEKRNRSTAVLSGGEQQRLAIARALFIKPTFLLADEPTAHVDEKTRDLILQILFDVQKTQGVGLIIASHDSALRSHMNVMYKLQDKRICQ